MALYKLAYEIFVTVPCRFFLANICPIIYN